MVATSSYCWWTCCSHITHCCGGCRQSRWFCISPADKISSFLKQNNSHITYISISVCENMGVGCCVILLCYLSIVPKDLGFKFQEVELADNPILAILCSLWASPSTLKCWGWRPHQFLPCKLQRLPSLRWEWHLSHPVAIKFISKNQKVRENRRIEMFNICSTVHLTVSRHLRFLTFQSPVLSQGSIPCACSVMAAVRDVSIPRISTWT